MRMFFTSRTPVQRKPMKNWPTLNAKRVRTLTTIGFWSNTSLLSTALVANTPPPAAETSLGEQGGRVIKELHNGMPGPGKMVDEAAFGGRS
jgi:hypothetical protein